MLDAYLEPEVDFLEEQKQDFILRLTEDMVEDILKGKKETVPDDLQSDIFEVVYSHIESNLEDYIPGPDYD